MNCPKCGWEGEATEPIEEPSKLRINDGFGSLIYFMAVKRNVYLCPRCRGALRTAKFIYGIEVESEDLV